jgi:hypothetical protein
MKLTSEERSAYDELTETHGKLSDRTFNFSNFKN